MEITMRYVITLIVMLLMVGQGFAANDAYIISQKGVVKIMPLYQNWEIEDGYQVSEMSIPLFFYYPINRAMSFYLRGSQASATGDVPNLSGISDTQVSFNYHVEAYHLVLNVGLNVPSGKKELTATEFQTSSVLSYNYFNFQVPNFGQGLNISAGLTYAYPIKDNVVIGLGASYQYKGKFKPLKGMLDDYDPGDEILFTGGVDLRLDEKTACSVDMIYVLYSTDQIDEEKVFESGNSLIASIQFRRYFNNNELWLLARYRTKAKNSYVIGGVFQEEPAKTVPEQLEGIGQFRILVNPGLYITILGEGRSYFSTKNFPGLDIMGFGLSPELALSSRYTVHAKVKYLFGDFPGGPTLSGWEIGLGVDIRF